MVKSLSLVLLLGAFALTVTDAQRIYRRVSSPVEPVTVTEYVSLSPVTVTVTECPSTGSITASSEPTPTSSTELSSSSLEPTITFIDDVVSDTITSSDITSPASSIEITSSFTEPETTTSSFKVTSTSIESASETLSDFITSTSSVETSSSETITLTSQPTESASDYDVITSTSSFDTASETITSTLQPTESASDYDVITSTSSAESTSETISSTSPPTESATATISTSPKHLAPVKFWRRAPWHLLLALHPLWLDQSFPPLPCPTSSVAPANTAAIVNGDFNGTPGKPNSIAPWTEVQGSNANLKVVRAAEGANPAAASGHGPKYLQESIQDKENAAFQQTVLDIVPRQRYTLSLMGKVKAELLAKRKQNICYIWICEKNICSEQQAFRPGENWTPVSFTFIAGKNQKKAPVTVWTFCQGNNADRINTVYIDAISIKPVPIRFVEKS
ncbi:hypothetical protein HYALB_00011039 [Hymenoscyphus albidus]|uniref:CBM-cenC domain-containing protein n=1 Tax=Hymenoscyphus albidus TaxID=595503 RepID=A0A9N9LYE6_9HELO|nr:hypothetical protein HYALB_00011039 [Hymenoscyphus albidus]